jgi:hypothetical protein
MRQKKRKSNNSRGAVVFEVAGYAEAITPSYSTGKVSASEVQLLHLPRGVPKGTLPGFCSPSQFLLHFDKYLR